MTWLWLVAKEKIQPETVQLNLLAGEMVVLSLEWGQNVREMLLYPPALCAR